MFRRAAVLSVALALALSSLLMGCESDSTSPGEGGPSPMDFSGNWALSGEVTAKRVCDNEIGDTRNWDAVITQIGNIASITINGGQSTDLVVSGSNATGSKTEGEMLDFALTLEAGELGGTITARNDVLPCTEVWALEGSRTNGAPSSDFSGSWDFDIAVTASGCVGDPVGTMELLCLRIDIDGNTVSIEDEDGTIAGVGDGDTAILTRTDAGESLEVTLTVSGNSISGQAVTFDFEDQCEVTQSISATKRNTPCQPPQSSDEFAGSWDMLISVVSSDCFDEQVGENFGICMTATVQGSNISLDDGSSEGLITGTINGDSASLSRSDTEGNLTVDLELDGDEVFGSATMNYTSGDCAGSTVQYSIDGSRRDSACGSGSGGEFEGFWIITGEFITNECGFTINPDCSQFVQNGNTVSIVDEGLQGTVSGNTLTIHDEEVDELVGLVTIDIVAQLSGDGNSFTGTQTITLSDPEDSQNSCTSEAAITGTRTPSCVPTGSSFGIMVPTRDR